MELIAGETPDTAGAAGAAKTALDSRRAMVQEARLIIFTEKTGQDTRVGTLAVGFCLTFRPAFIYETPAHRTIGDVICSTLVTKFCMIHGERRRVSSDLDRCAACEVGPIACASREVLRLRDTAIATNGFESCHFFNISPRSRWRSDRVRQ